MVVLFFLDYDYLNKCSYVPLKQNWRNIIMCTHYRFSVSSFLKRKQKFSGVKTDISVNWARCQNFLLECQPPTHSRSARMSIYLAWGLLWFCYRKLPRCLASWVETIPLSIWHLQHSNSAVWSCPYKVLVTVSNPSSVEVSLTFSSSLQKRTSSEL